MDTFGTRLRQLRNENNLKQEELAKILGVTHNAISQWELDRSKPGFYMLVELSKYYRVTLDYLMVGKI